MDAAYKNAAEQKGSKGRGMEKKEQEILSADHYGQQAREFFLKRQVKKVLLVCGASTGRSIQIPQEAGGLQLVRFSDFAPNPDRVSADRGAGLFCREGCEAVLAVGGGSAMDVAKCIRLSAGQAGVPFAAVPTTAGSGSEATRFAVVYENGKKQSITDERCLPDAVLFAPKLLASLPEYQKKSALLDALCHAVESWWSVRATAQSRRYAAQAVQLILEHMDAYLGGEEEAARQMLFAANLAGKAINLAQTTAGHAMSYGMTARYGIAHGHAAALCVSKLWPYLLEQAGHWPDAGESGLGAVLDGLAEAMGCNHRMDAARKFGQIVSGLELGVPKADSQDPALLKTTVQADRLCNFPVRLEEKGLEELYRQILEDNGNGGQI